MKAFRALLTVLAATSAGWANASETVARPFVGVTWIRRVETAPRPLRMHIVDIDLAAPGICFRLTPHRPPLHTRKQTTLEYLKEQHAQIAVNAHFFEPWPPPAPDSGAASLVGIAASDGDVYAPFLDKPPKPRAIRPNAPGLNIDPAGRASIVHRSAADPGGYALVERVALHNTLAGNEQIVTDGEVTAADSAWNHQLAPRTAIALTADRHLILVVVDGRQPGVSEGMSVPELAELLARRHRAVNALNLDGGGSTTLAIAAPTPRVVNVPVGVKDIPGTQRAVGSNLAVFARPRGPTTAARDAGAPGTGPGHPSLACWSVMVVLVCLAGAIAFAGWRRRSLRIRPSSRRPRG